MSVLIVVRSEIIIHPIVLRTPGKIYNRIRIIGDALWVKGYGGKGSVLPISNRGFDYFV